MNQSASNSAPFSRRMVGRILAMILLGLTSAHAGTPFAIEVVDEATGRGVPLIELRTVHEVRYVTDSRGSWPLTRRV